MHLPHSVCDKASKATKSKSPEVVNVVDDAGTVLEEFDLTESGNQIHSYVKVKPGDEITLRYAIPGMGGQIIDVYIDGVLRETHITNISKTTVHRGHVKKVCACEVRPSGARGKMEYYYMVVEERKTSKAKIGRFAADISPFSPNYGNLQPSAVGTIEVRVLREMPPATDSQISSKPEQAIRGPNFEDSLRWWNVSGRVDPGIIAPAYQIGFINGRKTQGSSRKNVKRSIDGYCLWASFKFFYRSASDIEAAGLKADNHPGKLPPTNTVSRSAHLTESSQSKKLAVTAAPSTEEMAASSLEPSTKLSIHQENSGHTPITVGKDRNDKEALNTPRSFQPSCKTHDGENEMKGTGDGFSKNVKVENIKNLHPLGSLVDQEHLKGTPSQEFRQATTPVPNQVVVAHAMDQKAIAKNGNVDGMRLFVSQHENLHDSFEKNDAFDPLIKNGTISAIPGITTPSSPFSPSPISSGRDVNMVSETYKDTSVAAVQKSYSAQHADSDSLMRAKTGHYMSRSPLVDKEDTEDLENQAKAMTNGKGNWRNRAAKMLEAISVPLNDHTLIESSRTGLPYEALTAHDLSNELSTNPVSNPPNKRKLEQLNFDSPSPTSGSKPSFQSQLGQGMSPKQLREEHARKKMAKQRALKIKMEEAATLRRQVEVMEAERAAQQELELQDLDAETEKFEVEAQAWAARLRELGEEYCTDDTTMS